MPDTESVSCMIAVRSASDSWVWPETSRRMAPTLRLKMRKKGRMPRESTVSCQLRMNMAPIVEIAIVMLDKTLDAVSVRTDWTPPTSFDRRDWISPVRVEVKKRSDICCRCEYRE